MAERAKTARPQPSAERPKVLYVMGAGRSGSTILGVALGNCANVFFAGELNRWLPRAGVPTREDAPRVDFWKHVRDEIDGADELFGARTGALERSSALLDPRKWLLRRRLRAGYRRVAEQLYEAIARAAAVGEIVDTSHYPLRARELKALAGIDLYLLFLVRDPQSTVASLGRDDVRERRFGVVASNLYLWLTYLFSLLTFIGHARRRRLFIRHEQFLADPEGVLTQILALAGSAAPAPQLGSLDTGLAFHGNRLIESDVVALTPAEPRPVRRSFATAVLQLPWKVVFACLRPAVSVR